MSQKEAANRPQAPVIRRLIWSTTDLPRQTPPHFRRVPVAISFQTDARGSRIGAAFLGDGGRIGVHPVEWSLGSMGNRQTEPGGGSLRGAVAASLRRPLANFASWSNCASRVDPKHGVSS